MEYRKCQRCRYVIVLFSVLIQSVNVQFMPMFPSPMFGMPPMSPVMPPPMPAMMSMVIKVPSQPKTTTTTTKPTTITSPAPKKQNGVAIAIPVPMPIPLQVAFSAQPPPLFCISKPRPPSCPPCPPCICSPCTPAFFSYCSPCHKRCRCRDSKDAPVPLPPVPPMPASGPAYAFPVPSSALMVPMPSLVKAKPYKDSCSDEFNASNDHSSSDSSSTERRRNKQIRQSWKKSKKRNHYRKQRKRTRRHFQTSRTRDFGDDELIKPVLSFINRRGDVKINRKLTEADAEQLMRDSLEIERENKIFNQAENPDGVTLNDKVKNVRVWTNQDAKKKTQLTVMSSYNNKDVGNVENFRKNNRQVVLRDGESKIGSAIVEEGRKELVFKPSEDKTISNLSLSFQVV